MENLPILEKLLLFKEQHPAIPLHFHLGDFPTLKKRCLLYTSLLSTEAGML